MGNGQPEVLDELTRRGFTDIAVVGRGGHAVVYRAEQPAFGRTVAVKVLTDADLDPVAFERFERERRAAGSMSNHPNILTVYEGGVTRSGQAFLVTEYAPRGNLAERVARRGPVPWPEAVVTGIKLAGALETAHRLGVVHRDVKPENVLLSDYGEPLLGDFGIARITGGFVTSTTIIRASVAHVPPEVLEGERPRPSTDVYSLASTILTVIWGRPPFFSEDEPVGVLSDRIAREAPPDLRTRGVPGAVCRVLERGLAKRPSDRPPSALAFGEELRAAQRAMGQAVTSLPMVSADGDDGRQLTGAGDPTPAPVLPDVHAPGDVGARHEAARRRRRARLVRAGAVAGVLAVAGAAAGAAVVLRDGGGEAVDVPADGLAATRDRLWVVGGGGGGAELAAFSLPDGRAMEVPPGVPTGVVAVAAEGTTWVLNDRGVHRLATDGVGSAQVIDGVPVAVEVEADRVWLLDVVGEDLVLGSFDVDGSPEALREVIGPAAEDDEGTPRGALAVEGSDVWVADGGRTLLRRLPDGELEPVEVDRDVVDLAIDGRFVWAGTSDGRLLRIDRGSLDVTDVAVSTAAITEVVAGAGNVWTADGEGLVRRVAGDVRGGRALALDAGRKVLALDDADEVLYVVNAETGAVDRVDARSGTFDSADRIDLTDALG